MEKKPLPKNIRTAGLGRRTLSVLLDAAFFVGLAILLYQTVGTLGILNHNSYYPTLDAQKAYVERSGLLTEANQRGTFLYNSYTDPEDAETTGKYAYKEYIRDTWNFFMDFVPANASEYTVNLSISLTTPVSTLTGYADTPSPTSQEYGKWVYANFFGYAEGAENNYFIPSIENDFTSSPVAAKDEKQYHAVLLQSMFDGERLKGHYVDACNLLGSQPKISEFKNSINVAAWAARLPGLLGAALILYMIIPIFVPNGRTLGKLICGVGVIGKDGYGAAKINIFLRQFIITVIWSLLALPWTVVAVPLLSLLLVLEYVFIVMTAHHVGLHDMLAGTIAVDVKKTTWFASKEDEEDFIAEHPQSPLAKKRREEEEKQSPAYLAAQARFEAEESILDLSTINKRREEAGAMTSFDEFEKQSDAKFEEKKKEAEEEKEERDLTVDELAEMEGISKEEAEALLQEWEKEAEEEDDSDGFTDKK